MSQKKKKKQVPSSYIFAQWQWKEFFAVVSLLRLQHGRWESQATSFQCSDCIGGSIIALQTHVLQAETEEQPVIVSRSRFTEKSSWIVSTSKRNNNNYKNSTTTTTTGSYTLPRSLSYRRLISFPLCRAATRLLRPPARRPPPTLQAKRLQSVVAPKGISKEEEGDFFFQVLFDYLSSCCSRKESSLICLPCMRIRVRQHCIVAQHRYPMHTKQRQRRRQCVCYQLGCEGKELDVTRNERRGIINYKNVENFSPLWEWSQSCARVNSTASWTRVEAASL